MDEEIEDYFFMSFLCGYETIDYDDALIHAMKCPVCGDD